MPTLSSQPNPVVIRPGALGDMILLSPLIRRLHQHDGQPCVVIVSGPWCEPVYRGNPHVAQVLSLARHEPLPLRVSWWRARAALRRTDPGPIFVCEERRIRSVNRLLSWSGIDPARCRFLAERAIEDDTHEVDRLLSLAEHCPPRSPAERQTPAGASAGTVPFLAVSESERQRCREWIQARGWGSRPLVLIQPGNRRTMSSRRRRHRRLNRDDKAWPITHWARLLQDLHNRAPSATLLLCGAPREAALLREIGRLARLDSVAIAALELRDLLALCECAHSMISVDTGPAHAAAALGLPLVVMFGGQPPARWLPRSATSPVSRVGGLPETVRVDQIAVEAVLEAWLRLPSGATALACEAQSSTRGASAAARPPAGKSERHALSTEPTEIWSTRFADGEPSSPMTPEPELRGSQTLGD
jgi:heptosyltransferase-2/heptosyltransferase-3